VRVVLKVIGIIGDQLGADHAPGSPAADPPIGVAVATDVALGRHRAVRAAGRIGGAARLADGASRVMALIERVVRQGFWADGAGVATRPAARARRRAGRSPCTARTGSSSRAGGAGASSGSVDSSGSGRSTGAGDSSGSSRSTGAGDSSGSSRSTGAGDSSGSSRSAGSSRSSGGDSSGSGDSSGPGRPAGASRSSGALGSSDAGSARSARGSGRAHGSGAPLDSGGASGSSRRVGRGAIHPAVRSWVDFPATEESSQGQ